MNTTCGLMLVAFYRCRDDAVLVVDRLRQAGFDSDDVNVCIGDAQPSAADASGIVQSTKDCRGVIKGMFIGCIVGFVAGAIVPLVGPATQSPLAMGVLSMALGFGAAGIVTGGLLGAIVCDDEMPSTSPRPTQDCTIVTIRTSQRASEVLRILDVQGN